MELRPGYQQYWADPLLANLVLWRVRCLRIVPSARSALGCLQHGATWNRAEVTLWAWRRNHIVRVSQTKFAPSPRPPFGFNRPNSGPVFKWGLDGMDSRELGAGIRVDRCGKGRLEVDNVDFALKLLRLYVYDQGLARRDRSFDKIVCSELGRIYCRAAARTSAPACKPTPGDARGAAGGSVTAGREVV